MAATMRRAGFTLIEIIASSAIAAVVASGTMMAFVTAARLARAQNSTRVAEATDFAQQTLERFRNRVATDDTAVFPDLAGAGWQIDPLPPLPLPGTNSESLLWRTPTSRRYQVTSQDCDGDGTAGDCYAVTVRVCWDDPLC